MGVRGGGGEERGMGGVMAMMAAAAAEWRAGRGACEGRGDGQRTFDLTSTNSEGRRWMVPAASLTAMFSPRVRRAALSMLGIWITYWGPPLRVKRGRVMTAVTSEYSSASVIRDRTMKKASARATRSVRSSSLYLTSLL